MFILLAPQYHYGLYCTLFVCFVPMVHKVILVACNFVNVGVAWRMVYSRNSVVGTLVVEVDAGRFVVCCECSPSRMLLQIKVLKWKNPYFLHLWMLLLEVDNLSPLSSLFDWQLVFLLSILLQFLEVHWHDMDYSVPVGLQFP